MASRRSRSAGAERLAFEVTGEDIASRLRRLLVHGVKAREATIARGGDVWGIVTKADRAKAERHLASVAEALALAASMGNLAWLEAVAQHATELFDEFRNEVRPAVSLKDPRGRAGVAVRDFAEFLRDEVAELLEPKNDTEPASIDGVARLCATRIGGITKGLPTDRLAKGQREKLVREALGRLGKKRWPDPNAIVLSALRACGLDEPNIFKREQMAAVRSRRRSKSKGE